MHSQVLRPPWQGSDLTEPEGETEIDLGGLQATPMNQGSGSTGSGGTTSGSSKYPTATDKSDTFDDGNAAVAHINSGAYVGEASVQFSPTAGDIAVTGKKGAYTASVPITYGCG